MPAPPRGSSEELQHSKIQKYFTLALLVLLVTNIMSAYIAMHYTGLPLIKQHLDVADLIHCSASRYSKCCISSDTQKVTDRTLWSMSNRLYKEKNEQMMLSLISVRNVQRLFLIQEMNKVPIKTICIFFLRTYHMESFFK